MTFPNLKTFQRHARALDQIQRDAEKLFLVLEDEWLNLYKKQQEGENDKPDLFDKIEWEMGKQMIMSFRFSVFYERPAMSLVIEVTPGYYDMIIVQIDEEVMSLYQKITKQPHVL